MKYFLIAKGFFLMSCLICCCQNGSGRQNKKNDTSAKLTLTDSSILQNSRLSPFDFFLKKYADSINYIGNLNAIPVFISNPQFDYDNAGIWSPSHHPLPLRHLIVEKVHSCDALTLLIQSNNQSLKLKPVKKDSIDIEYIKLSFHELITLRYKKMKCSP